MLSDMDIPSPNPGNVTLMLGKSSTIMQLSTCQMRLLCIYTCDSVTASASCVARIMVPSQSCSVFHRLARDCTSCGDNTELASWQFSKYLTLPGIQT